MTIYNILLENKSGVIHDFFLFQKPAQYVGGAKIFSNSIYNTKLRNNTQAQITIEQQYYAGTQQSTSTNVGDVSGEVLSIQPVNLTPASGVASDNSVNLLLNPIGLSFPAPQTGVEAGAFRINTPSYNPATEGPINIGLATRTGVEDVLSNFILADPAQKVDCQPVVIFYLQTGAFIPGTVINFDESSATAAEMNATDGTLNFHVIYTPEGTWNVSPVSAAKFSALAK